MFDSGINAVHVQTVTCCYREQQQLPAEPQLSLHSHPCSEHSEPPDLGGTSYAVQHIWDALGLPKGATAPTAQTPIPQQRGHEL